MGIPKAFRWLSERYPLISQLIEEDRIPEFDNLYLDMNGIVHNCSHNNNEDLSFRISEEQIFLNVFAYIEHLFSKIKPKKLFFMAIDGVAPRAKMNQQRSRRFRAAKDVNDRILEAKRKGEDLPDDGSEAFQSNMITPGTPFMARLTANLRYFVNKKVSEDANWRGVQVVLSGHEVPGEGEHKIMEYIRLAKAQPAYDPNTRHCLYGLDADLIMLGLLSHDPHFCLLREEVLFGPARAKAASRGLESTNFYLMHLSLLREYLDIEFSDLKTVMPSSNPYDLERIIDDFILLAIFIGNDFLPHLPGLHINEGALNSLFDIYKQVVPTAGGYLNEHGLLAKDQLQKVLDHLAEFEREKFEEEQADSTWLRLKHAGKDAKKLNNKRAKGKLVLTKSQRQLLASMKTFIISNIDEPSLDAQLQLPCMETQDRRFLQQLGDELKLDISYDEFDTNDEPIVIVRLSQEIMELIAEDQVGLDADEEEWEDTDDQASDSRIDSTVRQVGTMRIHNDKSDSEWLQAVQRILAKYENAPSVLQASKSQAEHDQDYYTFVSNKLHAWKSDYYREKLQFDIVKQPQSLRDMAYAYIEGIQWVLHYYYDGVASWSWYYPYHYSPKISDLAGVGTMQFNFDLNIPFTPFQQLMGVLPGLSSNLVPAPYRDLMLDPNSPIIDFYPLEFEQDMNGKKQDWEAIVKIPFLDANRLVNTMATREPRLTDEERQRNSFGTSYTFIYDSTHMQTYPTSSPGFFPDLHNCHCRMEVFNLPTLGGLKFIKGLCEGALLGKDMLPGFPSLYTLPVTAKIAYHSVNVFQADSRNESVVLSVDNAYEVISVDQVAQQLLGKHTYVAWPFLREAKVTAVSDEERKYTLDSRTGAITAALQTGEQKEKWRRAAGRISHVQSKRYAVDIDRVDILVHVQPLKGLKRLDDGAHIKEWAPAEAEHAIQTIVSSVMRPDPRYQEQPAMPVEQEFPRGSKVFFLGPRNYGSPSVVVGHSKGLLTLQLGYFPSDDDEPRKFAALAAHRTQQRYFPSFVVTKRVGMSALTLSKITSGLMIEVAGQAGRVNIGLNLKFEAKAQKVLGYAQRNEHGWEFSEKAIALIQEYKESFPEIVAALDARRGDLIKASEFFPNNTDARVSALKAWIKEKGVRDFEKVSLYSDQMEKEAVWQTQDLQDQLYALKTPDSMKNAIFKNLARRMILKPEHAAYQLQHQSFAVGARVITCQETGSVPLGVKGVVVGIQAGFIDVVFDIAFIGGGTLGGRCSNYRGTSILPSHVLNLTDMQFVQPPSEASSAPANRHSTAAVRAPVTNGHNRESGNAPSAGAHPSYRGIAHHGIGSRGTSGPARGRLAPTKILSRGAMTGQFAAAASGDQSQAYSTPASQQASLLSSFGANLSHNNIEGRPPSMKKQDYTSVAPPASLNKSDVMPSRGHRGSSRARPGIGSSRGGATNGHGSAGPVNGEPADVTATLRGSTYRAGSARGRGRGRGHHGAPDVVRTV